MDSFELGHLAVERGLVTEAQLKECLEIQREGCTWRRLGEILLSEGLVTGVALANLLSVQQAMRKAVPGTPQASGIGAQEPPLTEVGWLIREATAYGATAVIMGAGRPPAFRAFGRTEFLEGPPLDRVQIQKMLAEALPPGLIQRLDEDGYADATCEMPPSQAVRVVLYRHGDGIGATFRPLSRRPADPESLGLPPGVKALERARTGLVLVTGPAASGRTTTLTALLQAINASRACHIVTIERPIETFLTPVKARISRREVGRDAESFHAALVAALRADADVIALSDLNDAETIATAVSAAETGHLVLGTMNTTNAYRTILRILDAFPPRRAPFVRGLLATCLRGIVSQRLFPPKPRERPSLAVELLLGTPGVANLIREDRAHQIPNVIQMGHGEGMVGLDDSLLQLVRKARITMEQAVEHAHDADRLRKAAGGRREGARAAH